MKPKTLYPSCKSFIRTLSAFGVAGVCMGQAWSQSVGGVASPDVQIRRLTLDQAVNMAILHSKEIEFALENYRKAGGVVGAADAAFNPQLDFNAQYLRYGKDSAVQFGPTFVQIYHADNPSLAATVSLPIDISGALRAAKDRADFMRIAAGLDVARARNDVVYIVKDAYYRVLRAEGAARVAGETLKNAKQRLSDAQKKEANGIATGLDIDRAETELASARQAEISAKDATSLALATLNQSLGIGIDSSVDVSPSASVSEPNHGAALQRSSYKQLVKQALARRPEMMEAAAGVSAARKGIEIVLASLRPSMNLALSGSYSPNVAGLDPQPWISTAVIAVSFPIFDGGSATARKTEAEADLATAKTRQDQEADTVTLDVRRAYLELNDAQQRFAVADKAVAQAKEAYRLAVLRYRNGVAPASGLSPLLEVSDAQTALTQALIDQVDSRFDVDLAVAALNRAVGLYAQGPVK